MSNARSNEIKGGVRTLNRAKSYVKPNDITDRVVANNPGAKGTPGLGLTSTNNQRNGNVKSNFGGKSNKSIGGNGPGRGTNVDVTPRSSTTGKSNVSVSVGNGRSIGDLIVALMHVLSQFK